VSRGQARCEAARLLEPEECLTLLPRRELRFWALDSGIAAERTDGLAEDDIINMILHAHGVTEEEENIQTHIYADIQVHPKVRAPEVDANVVVVKNGCREQELQKGLVEWKSVTTMSPAVASAPTTQASLASQTTTAASETPPPSQCAVGSISTTTASSAGRRTPNSGGLATAVDDWDEVLRYLTLHKAVHSDGDKGWDSVREILETLRDVHRNTPPAVPRGNSEALRQLQSQREAVERETASRSKDLAEALQQVRELQHECEILKMQLSVAREDRCSRKQRGEVQRETLLGDLKAAEAQLQTSRAEVDRMQQQLLSRGVLRVEQVNMVRDLRHERDNTEDMAVRLKTMSFAAQQRLDASCRERVVQQLASDSRCPSAPSKLNGSGVRREASFTVPTLSGAEGPEGTASLPPRIGAKVLDDRVASPPLIYGGREGEAGILSWDSVRRSIERLRSKCHLAATEARREREALAAREGSSGGCAWRSP